MKAIRLVLAALIGLLAALWTAERPGDPALFPPAPGARVEVVRLLDNGFHTDLILPRAVLTAGDDALAQAARALPPGDGVRVGWGDAAFYVGEGPVSARLPDGARALFRPGGNPSVLMLEAIRRAPASGPEKAGTLSIALSVEGMAALRAQVGRALKTDAQGRPIVVARRDSQGVVFYAGLDAFWIGRTCNRWTAEALDAAGLPMPMMRVLTSGAVMRAAERARTAKLEAAGAGLGGRGRLDRAPSRSRAGVRSPAARDGGASWPASSIPATPPAPWGRRSASSAPAN